MNDFFDGKIAIGILLGVLASIFFEFHFDFFGSAFEPSEVVLATILGAAIALCGTYFAISSEETRRDKTKKEVERALATKFGVRLFLASSHISDLAKIIHQAISNPTPDDTPYPVLNFVISESDLTKHDIPDDEIVFAFSHTSSSLKFKLLQFLEDYKTLVKRCSWIHETRKATISKCSSGEHNNAPLNNSISINSEKVEEFHDRMSHLTSYMKPLDEFAEKTLNLSLEVTIEALAEMKAKGLEGDFLNIQEIKDNGY